MTSAIVQNGSAIDTQFLKNHSLFGGLTDEAIENIKVLLETTEFPDGTDIISEGQPNSKIYFIISGTVKILKNDREVAAFGTGEVFGEIEFLDVMPAAATVRAQGPVKVATYTGAALHHIFKKDPEAFSFLVMNLARDLSRRLRAMDERFGLMKDFPGTT